MTHQTSQKCLDINNDFDIEHYDVKRLKEEDLCHIHLLCEHSRDYFLLDQATQPSEMTAREILQALPPGKKYEDKYLVAYFDKEKGLVALIDLIRNYPTLNTWTLGLLIIDPSFRKHGLGALIHKK